MINVLYLGMEDDIMLPLLMVPDLDTIHCIGIPDPCYSPTGLQEDQRDEIIGILTNGNDSMSRSRKVHMDSKDGNILQSIKRKRTDIHQLNGRSIILSDTRCPKCLNEGHTKNCNLIKRTHGVDCMERTVRCKYNNKNRRLIVHYGDFLYEWPEEIKNITHIFGVGSFSTDSYQYNINNKNKQSFLKMIRTRTIDRFKFYEILFEESLRQYNKIWIVEHGRNRYGDFIAEIQFDKSKDDYDQLMKHGNPPNSNYWYVVEDLKSGVCHVMMRNSK